MKELTAEALHSYTMQVMRLAVAKKQYADKANSDIEKFSNAAAVVGTAMGTDPAYDVFVTNRILLIATMREQRDAKNEWFDAEEVRLRTEFFATLQD